jgi:hypothetical protein
MTGEWDWDCYAAFPDPFDWSLNHDLYGDDAFDFNGEENYLAGGERDAYGAGADDVQPDILWESQMNLTVSNTEVSSPGMGYPAHGRIPRARHNTQDGAAFAAFLVEAIQAVAVDATKLLEYGVGLVDECLLVISQRRVQEVIGRKATYIRDNLARLQFRYDPEAGKASETWSQAARAFGLNRHKWCIYVGNVEELRNRAASFGQ